MEHNEKLLSFKDLQETIPLGRTKIYEMIKMGKIPKPLKIGMRSFWVHSEIQNFIISLKS